MGDKILDENLYELLGISIDATTQKVKKAYRKTALKYHPDKNPDNPKAAELFHKLSKALEILTDESARAAYDKVLRGKEAAKIRNQQLDSRRKKFKEELEARERAAQEAAAKHNKFDPRTDEERLQAEIERLRKEGSKQVEEEIRYVQQLIEEEREKRADVKDELEQRLYRLRIRWNVSKEDTSNGNYNYDLLHRLLSKHGNVVALLISPKKKGRALVEFDSELAAVSAQKYEKGLTSNPLIVEWLSKPPQEKTNNSQSQPVYSATIGNQDNGLFPSINLGTSTGSSFGSHSYPFSSDTKNISSRVTETDFENLVLRRMRQAEEQKKIIRQTEEEEDATS